MSIKREELQELQLRAGVRAKLLLNYTEAQGYALRQCNGIAAGLFQVPKQEFTAPPLMWADMPEPLRDYVSALADNLNGKLEQQLPSLEVPGPQPVKYFGRLYLHHTEQDDGQPETWLFVLMQNAANWSSANQEGLDARKLETIGELASGVAHDFNNLIMGIQANAECLLPDLESDPHSSALAVNIIRACSAGSSLTRSLLGYAKRQPLTKGEFDLVELVNDVANIARLSLSKRHQIVLSEELRSGGPITVVGCYSSLSHCLINLIKNAREAMPEGGDVRLRWVGDEATAGLEVSDGGNGISPEELESIFEPFYSTKKQGTGLGLAMVQGIMSQHSGEVTIASQPGVGTEVSLIWPRYQLDVPEAEAPAEAAPETENAEAVEAVPAGEDEALPSENGEAAPPRPVRPIVAHRPDSAEVVRRREAESANLHGRKSTKQIINSTQRTRQDVKQVAMIIDDDDLVREGVRGLVEHLGFQTVCYASAEDALAALEERSIPDLILVDFNMPGMDGSEFIRHWFEQLPALYREYGTRIILVSGFPPSHFQELTSRYNATQLSLLQKPFSLETLSRKIKKPKSPRSVTGRIAPPMPRPKKAIKASPIRQG
ncbi:MAG: ATP-binding protein [Verrucomicrobiota bacterium]